MILFVIFAIVLATILLSIVLEKLFHSPILVATTFFSVYLIILAILFVTGVVTDLAVALIAIIVLTIISFVTAVIVRFIKCICFKFLGDCCNLCPRGNNENILRTDDTNNGNLMTISCRCGNGNTEDLLSISSNCLNSGNDENEDNSNCGCGNRGTVSILDDRN